MDGQYHKSWISILETSKIVMYEFWYNQVKSKYAEKTKLCYMDTDSFKFYIETGDIYVDMQKMLIQDLIFQIMNKASHYLKEKIKK